jgi:tryptophanyl-tRNA synthetase
VDALGERVGRGQRPRLQQGGGAAGLPLASMFAGCDKAARLIAAWIEMAKSSELVFSGVQPTGNLHLGNYLGALKRFVELQATHACLYCVVDLHAMTMPHDPATLRRTTREVTAAFIACGIDPQKNIVFNQSRVAEHAELTWALDCVARLGWLNRMTQFKEKAGKDREAASIGLYNYPVLMAADILVYRATHVPVGEDQKQHLELARDIAQKFNNDFAPSIAEHGWGEAFFPLPEPLIQGPATRVMSLRDGTKKMSKSDPSENARIALTDDAEAIAQKIRKAKTDADALPSEVEGLAGRPEADNLVGIYAALADQTKSDVLRRFGGGQFSQFKNALAELTVTQLTPIRAEILRLDADPGFVDSVLAEGARKAREIARPNMDAVKDILGLIR